MNNGDEDCEIIKAISKFAGKALLGGHDALLRKRKAVQSWSRPAPIMEKVKIREVSIERFT